MGSGAMGDDWRTDLWIAVKGEYKAKKVAKCSDKRYKQFEELKEKNEALNMQREDRSYPQRSDYRSRKESRKD